MPWGIPGVVVVVVVVLGGVVVVLEVVTTVVADPQRRCCGSAVLATVVRVLGVAVVVVVDVAVAVMVVVIVVVLVGVMVVLGVHRHRAAEPHDGLWDVVEQRRQLFPVDGPLTVHVVEVEDELHLLLPAAPARHRQPAHELLVIDLPRALLVENRK